ncbi:hypothetical protein BZL39_M00390 [Zygosaccharomyces parabailii]|nr:hypothetical protein BZL39_M00390 [Zygosaccharomyces parabailii]
MLTTDMQPPPYRIFGGKRIMPIVHLPYDAGFYVFSSEQSHEKWEGFEVKRPSLNQDGQGIPLFHFKKRPCFFGSSRKPDYLIYKYIVQKCEEPPPCDKSEVITDDNFYCLYKVLFCEVYTRYEGYSVVYKLKFPLYFKDVQHYDFVNCSKQVGYCGSLEGFDLSWKLCDKKLDEYELWSDFENTSHLVNGAFTNAKEKLERRVDSPLSATALYSRRKCNPNDRDANLIFLEQSQPISLGITAVPALTEVLACHGMLVHLRRRQIREDEARRRMAAASNSSAQLATTMVMFEFSMGSF